VNTEQIGNATLIEGDSRRQLQLYHLPSPHAIVCDPPYGLGNRTDYATQGRSREMLSTDFPQPYGYDEPFDPTMWLSAKLWAFCGADNFKRHLPDSCSWVTWDKEPATDGRYHQAEMIALSRPGRPVVFPFAWLGARNAGRGTYDQQVRSHPSQKPVELMAFIIEQLGIAADVPVVDPYMGSGSTGIAALVLGYSFIGWESHPHYFEVACRRMQAAVDEQWTVETASTRLPRGGNVARQRKLKKHRPDLAGQVIAGALTVRQALKEAGLKP